jgi:hypothetical protein
VLDLPQAVITQVRWAPVTNDKESPSCPASDAGVGDLVGTDGDQEETGEEEPDSPREPIWSYRFICVIGIVDEVLYAGSRSASEGRTPLIVGIDLKAGNSTEMTDVSRQERQIISDGGCSDEEIEIGNYLT